MNRKSFGTLELALGLSLVVHAALLAVRFADPQAFNRVFKDTPLEVVLVNARSQERPERAQAIAQASLAGGGEADRGRATSPLPPSLEAQAGEASEQGQRQLEALQEQQMQLLAQLKKRLASLPPPQPRRPLTPEQAQREEQRRQLASTLAEIERRIEEENSRPKKRYISPATREEEYASYYDRLRRRIEQRGTRNFPEAAGRKLYGELTMVVTVNHDGRVLDTEVVQSSGNATLDRRAVHIARAAAPFGSFNPAMRRKADQIVVVSRFRFSRDETLETRLTASP